MKRNGRTKPKESPMASQLREIAQQEFETAVREAVKRQEFVYYGVEQVMERVQYTALPDMIYALNRLMREGILTYEVAESIIAYYCGFEWADQYSTIVENSRIDAGTSNGVEGQVFHAVSVENMGSDWLCQSMANIRCRNGEWQFSYAYYGVRRLRHVV